MKAALTLGVTHAPYRRVLDAFVDRGADLMLAGHTHGGQVCVPGYGALVTNCDIPRDQVKGVSTWTHDGRTATLEVSAGLGTSIYAPVRFACRPEATLLTLTAAPDVAGRARRSTGASAILDQPAPAGDRDIAQLGSAPRSGRGGRGFESRYPDHFPLDPLRPARPTSARREWIPSVIDLARRARRAGRRRLARLARRARGRPRRRVARPREEGRHSPHLPPLRRGAGGGALQRLDRRPEARHRRRGVRASASRRGGRRRSGPTRNVGIVAALVAAGRMRPRGQAEIDRAKADGRWDRAYAGAATRGAAGGPRGRARRLPAGGRAVRRAEPGEPVRGDPPDRHGAERDGRANRLAKLVAMLEDGGSPYPQ